MSRASFATRRFSIFWRRASFPISCAITPLDRPLRIWVAGCSSGEETYSLAMLFREQIDASKRDIKLQIFASDVDPDAVASAREGLYPAIDRGRGFARTIGAVLHQGGS